MCREELIIYLAWHCSPWKGLLAGLVFVQCLGTWILGPSPPFPRLIRAAHCAEAVFIDHVFYASCLLSFWKSGTLAHARQRAPKWPVLNQIPGHGVPDEPCWWWYSRCWRNRRSSMWFHWERTLEASFCFPPHFAPCAFSRCWFCFVSIFSLW